MFVNSHVLAARPVGQLGEQVLAQFFFGAADFTASATVRVLVHRLYITLWGAPAAKGVLTTRRNVGRGTEPR